MKKLEIYFSEFNYYIYIDCIFSPAGKFVKGVAYSWNNAYHYWNYYCLPSKFLKFFSLIPLLRFDTIMISFHLLQTNLLWHLCNSTYSCFGQSMGRIYNTSYKWSCSNSLCCFSVDITYQGMLSLFFFFNQLFLSFNFCSVFCVFFIGCLFMTQSIFASFASNILDSF